MFRNGKCLLFILLLLYLNHQGVSLFQKSYKFYILEAFWSEMIELLHCFFNPQIFFLKASYQDFENVFTIVNRNSLDRLIHVTARK